MKHRLLLAGFSSAGAIETGYLSFVKLFSPTLLCNGESCNNVLSSSFSKIPFIDVPLVSVAFISYSFISILSILPIIEANLFNKKVDAAQVKKNDSIVLFTTTSMATFSTYLMFLLAFILRESCYYCYGSAFLSFTMAILAWKQNVISNATKATIISSSSFIFTAMLSAFLFYTTSVVILTENVAANTQQLPSTVVVQSNTINEKEKLDKTNSKYTPPTVTTRSTEKALLLADKLNFFKAKMYGAYWCSHCFNQKQSLGEEAFEKIEYLECDKEGFNSQYNVCKARKVLLLFLLLLLLLFILLVLYYYYYYYIIVIIIIVIIFNIIIILLLLLLLLFFVISLLLVFCFF
jgi:uncharacterized membrane protein